MESTPKILAEATDHKTRKGGDQGTNGFGILFYSNLFMEVRDEEDM